MKVDLEKPSGKSTSKSKLPAQKIIGFSEKIFLNKARNKPAKALSDTSSSETIKTKARAQREPPKGPKRQRSATASSSSSDSIPSQANRKEIQLAKGRTTSPAWDIEDENANLPSSDVSVPLARMKGPRPPSLTHASESHISRRFSSVSRVESLKPQDSASQNDVHSDAEEDDEQPIVDVCSKYFVKLVDGKVGSEMRPRDELTANLFADVQQSASLPEPPQWRSRFQGYRDRYTVPLRRRHQGGQAPTGDASWLSWEINWGDGGQSPVQYVSGGEMGWKGERMDDQNANEWAHVDPLADIADVQLDFVEEQLWDEAEQGWERPTGGISGFQEEQWLGEPEDLWYPLEMEPNEYPNADLGLGRGDLVGLKEGDLEEELGPFGSRNWLENEVEERMSYPNLEDQMDEPGLRVEAESSIPSEDPGDRGLCRFLDGRAALLGLTFEPPTGMTEAGGRGIREMLAVETDVAMSLKNHWRPQKL